MDAEDVQLELAKLDPQKMTLGEIVKALMHCTGMITGKNIKEYCFGEEISAEEEAMAGAMTHFMEKCYKELDNREKKYYNTNTK